MKVLVYGWYNNYNIGDELFKEAFIHIFPNINFIFTNKIVASDLDRLDAIFFGGGSFLDGQPNFSEETLYKIANKKIFYIGIGADTLIHPWHKFLLKKAKFIACRSINNTIIKEINSNIEYYPDLVYSLSSEVSEPVVPKPKHILIIPNSYVVSKWNDPAWKELAWNYFKSEFSQFLDQLVENKYIINFFSMCKSSENNDMFAATEIINKMTHKSDYLLQNNDISFKELGQLFSQYDLIISQRYHGLILSDILKIPSISISHHNKLKGFNGGLNYNMSYYNLSKDLIIEKMNYILNDKHDNFISIKQDIFEGLRTKVTSLIEKE